MGERPNFCLISSLYNREPFDNWSSSFSLRVGSPSQVVRVLPSTAGQATWVVSTLGCPSDAPPSCRDIRGGLFDNSTSSTWKELGIYPQQGSNLYPPDNATYGLDTVGLGITEATGGPTLDSQVVAAIAGYQNVLGIFGLGQEPVNFTDFTDPRPSFLSTLHTRRLIPSLSWAYTAGARYRTCISICWTALTIVNLIDSNRT